MQTNYTNEVSTSFKRMQPHSQIKFITTLCILDASGSSVVPVWLQTIRFSLGDGKTKNVLEGQVNRAWACVCVCGKEKGAAYRNKKYERFRVGFASIRTIDKRSQLDNY